MQNKERATSKCDNDEVSHGSDDDDLLHKKKRSSNPQHGW
jgi:hypothetical protein